MEADDVHRFFERNGFCPYTDICESFQTISRAESWMEKALLKHARGKAQDVSSPDGGDSIQNIQGRLEHMRRVKDRCYSHCGRCLRFWQFEAREEKAHPVHRRGVTQFPKMSEGEAAVEPSS